MKNTIVSTPLNLPKLVPKSWELWWEIWKQADFLKKEKESPNTMSGIHFGFDIFKYPGFTPVYKAKHVDLKKLDPDLYEQIMNLPIKIYCARFVQSRGNFLPHVDNSFESWSIRNMFYCQDEYPQWYYSTLKNNSERNLILPKEINWWAYLDGAIKHGTHFKENSPKILLQIFSEKESTRLFVENNIEMFPEYQIIYNREQDVFIT